MFVQPLGLASMLFVITLLCKFVKLDFVVRSNLSGSANGMGEIRLCCEIGSTFYPRSNCQPISMAGHTHQDFYRNVWDEDTSVPYSRSHLLRDFDSRTGVPGCTDLIMIPLKESWDLFRNGTVRYENVLLNTSSYCISPTYIHNESRVIFPFYACKSMLKVETSASAFYLAYCMIASIPFLVLTFVVYAILPDLRNVHGMSLMCYVSGLAGTFAGMALIQMEYAGKDRVCFLLGPVTYFLIMFSFFWLNVISFDLWWNFRGSGKLRPTTRTSDLRKFQMFSIYAWLSSLLLMAISICVEYLQLTPESLRPGYSVGSCFLKKSKLSQFLYLYLPIIVIMMANAIFFLLTARKIQLLQQEICMVTGSTESGRHQMRLSSEQEQFGLFGRLYIVMGVTWVLDVVSWTLDDTIGLVFRPSDLCNALQGPIIFTLFVLKQNVRRMLFIKFVGVPKKPREYAIRLSNATQSSNTCSDDHNLNVHKPPT